MVYFENEAAVLYVFPDQNLSLTQWMGFANSQSLRDILHHAKQMLSDFPIYYTLSDNRKLKVIRPVDLDYINNEWMPEVLKNNQIKKSATIESEDVFGKISTDKILREADDLINFDMAFFDNMEEATEWLGVHINQEELR